MFEKGVYLINGYRDHGLALGMTRPAMAGVRRHGLSRGRAAPCITSRRKSATWVAMGSSADRSAGNGDLLRWYKKPEAWRSRFGDAVNQTFNESLNLAGL